MRHAYGRLLHVRIKDFPNLDADVRALHRKSGPRLLTDLQKPTRVTEADYCRLFLRTSGRQRSIISIYVRSVLDACLTQHPRHGARAGPV